MGRDEWEAERETITTRTRTRTRTINNNNICTREVFYLKGSFVLVSRQTQIYGCKKCSYRYRRDFTYIEAISKEKVEKVTAHLNRFINMEKRVSVFWFNITNVCYVDLDRKSYNRVVKLSVEERKHPLCSLWFPSTRLFKRPFRIVLAAL